MYTLLLSHDWQRRTGFKTTFCWVKCTEKYNSTVKWIDKNLKSWGRFFKYPEKLHRVKLLARSSFLIYAKLSWIPHFHITFPLLLLQIYIIAAWAAVALCAGVTKACRKNLKSMSGWMDGRMELPLPAGPIALLPIIELIRAHTAKPWRNRHLLL